MPTQIISFKKEVTSAFMDQQLLPVTVKGVVTEALMAFPAGCHQLVDVRFLYLPSGGGRINLMPSEDDQFIALDNFTATFKPLARVDVGGQLAVEWWNYDSRNAHTVPVVVQITPDRT